MPTSEPTRAARPATHDAMWHSPLPPFVRAHRFLECLGTLSAADWQRVVHRATEADGAVHRAALRRLDALRAEHGQLRAFAALRRVADDALDAVQRRQRMAPELATRAASLAAQAAFALALRERLPACDAVALYTPVASALSARRPADARPRLARDGAIT